MQYVTSNNRTDIDLRKKIDKKVIIFALFMLFAKMNLWSDTLLINTKHPDKLRILLYDGQYYLKLVLNHDDSCFYTLAAFIGSYKIKKQEIIFTDLAPGTDTIIAKFLVWPPRRAGPNYTFDPEEIVCQMFGIKVKFSSDGGGNGVVGTGRILNDGRLKVGKEKYNIVVYESRTDSSANCQVPIIKTLEK